MAGELVLITGISGYVGFKILQAALEAGYHVRGIVRKQSRIEVLKTVLADEKLTANVEFIVVPDRAAPNVFDSLMDKVIYVIHVASPLPSVQLACAGHFHKFCLVWFTGWYPSAVKPIRGWGLAGLQDY